MARWIQIKEHPIRVTARGEWLSDETPLHPRVADLFARHVVPHLDGTYAIALGRSRQEIVVDDTPFVVTSMRVALNEKDEVDRIELVTSDGEHEELRPTTLMQSEAHVLYCRIERQGMMVPCRFAPGQYHELALYARQEPSVFVLPVGGGAFPIGAYDPMPIAVGSRPQG